MTWKLVCSIGIFGAVVGSVGCGDSKPTEPDPSVTVPSFIFVSDTNSMAQLYRFEDNSATRLTSDNGNDIDPQVAAGRIVFTSDRDGNREVYIGNLDLTQQHRVTNNLANDQSPALSPDGSTIVFVSDRSGIVRLWTVAAPEFTDVGTATATALTTGSSDYVPEQSPTWSPDGAHIAFTSTRDGLSQVFVVPAAGGDAEQVTHESGGAFSPVWSSDGSSIFFISGTGIANLRQVAVADGTTTDVASDPLGIGSPSCTSSTCIAVTDPDGDGGELIALSLTSSDRKTILARTTHQRQPAVIVR